MNYTEYCEKIRDIKPPEGMEFKQAIMWLNPSRLPVGLVAIPDGIEGIIKVPEIAENEYKRMVPVVALAKRAFAGNEQVTDIVLPSSIIRIPTGAFAGCTNLVNITIPRQVKHIKEGTFAGCVNLENVYYEGTAAEWKQIEIIHNKREIEFGPLIPGTPVQTIVADRDINIPGNEALFSANIYYKCDLGRMYPALGKRNR